MTEKKNKLLTKEHYSAGWPIMDCADSSNGTHFFYPSVLQVRFLLPLEKRIFSKGLSLFLPFRARLLLWVKWLLNAQSSYASKSLLAETDMMAEIKQPLGQKEIYTVIKIGTSGPYTKNTILFLNGDINPVAIGKIGTTEAAEVLLKNEARWLVGLSSNEHLAKCCPKLLFKKKLATAFVIVQSIGIGNFSGFSLTPNHVNFLSMLHKMFPAGNRFSGCIMQQEMERRFLNLKSKLTKDWENRIENSFKILNLEWKDRVIPLAAAHRDFAPWNIRLANGNVFVFDWEYASEGYIPLYDLFHFLLIPIAVKSEISSRQLVSIFHKVETFGRSLQEGTWKVQFPSLQLLAYLLDVCLMYLESHHGNESGCKVLLHFGKLIDAHRTRESS